MDNDLNKLNLVIYHYFEKDASYRDNFLHFLLFGVQEDNDYVMIMSGEHSLELPDLPNVRYVFTEPKRSDFGGYAELINQGLNIDPYQYIFFINSSVRGPFIPPYANSSWTQILLEQMRADVGMVGTSICTLKADFRHSLNYQARYGGNTPFSHVQTMAYVLRSEVLKKIIAQGFYQQDRDVSKTLAIEEYEIHLSQLVLAQGWNLRCLLPELNQVDYRKPHVNPNPSSTVGDPNEVLGYFGRSIHPYEGLFVKTNRHLFTEYYLNRLAYSMLIARAEDLPDVVMRSRSVVDHLERISSQSKQGDPVVDFSYLPGQQEERAQLEILRAEIAQAHEHLNDMLNSTSWKLTAPIRRLKDWFH